MGTHSSAAITENETYISDSIEGKIIQFPLENQNLEKERDIRSDTKVDGGSECSEVLLFVLLALNL